MAVVNASDVVEKCVNKERRAVAEGCFSPGTYTQDSLVGDLHEIHQDI